MKSKNFKLLLCLFILFCLYGCGSTRFDKVRVAKMDYPPDLRAKAMTRMMSNELGLDVEQIKKIQEINHRYAGETELIVDEKASDLKTLRKLNKVLKAKDKELKKVLSKEQFKLYLVKKDEFKEKLKELAKKNKDRKRGSRRKRGNEEE